MRYYVVSHVYFRPSIFHDHFFTHRKKYNVQLYIKTSIKLLQNVYLGIQRATLGT